MRCALILVVLLVSARAVAQDCADPRLSEAAAAILVAGATPLSVTGLVDASRIAGSNAVSLRALRSGAADVATLDAFAAEAQAREGAFFVCGEAETETSRLRIVGREGATLASSIVDDGRAIDVVVRVADVHPRLVVRAADGTSFERELLRAQSRVLLPDGFDDAFVAQVVASDAAGPRPVAELVVGVAVSASADDAEGEDAVGHVLRLRRLAGAPSLRRNAILDRVAAEHARRVCTEGRAVHATDGDDPVERVRRAGLEARLVGEVVARAEAHRAALAALDASPSHRITLEDPRFTDVGAGEVTDADAHVCTVVLLAAWPRFAGR